MSGELGRALRWPLWSWRNLIITAVLTLALLAVVGRATDGQASAVPPAASTTPYTTAPASELTSPAPTTVPTPGTTSTPTATTTVRPTSGAAPVESATAVASAFVRAWSADGASREGWHASMEPWASPELLRALASTDPAQVPADRVTGDGRLVASAKTSATVRVPTDGGDVLVTLSASGRGWKVRDIAPADAPPAAETPSLTRTTPGN